MIPLRDSTRSRSFPVITVLLIILNLYIFFKQSVMPDNQYIIFMHQYALIPAGLYHSILQYSVWGLFYTPLVTSFFLHGSWLHVLSNMLYLWIFGDNIEDKLGHFRFFIFYMLCGIIANLSHVALDLSSTVPLVGASGAIAGVLGAYFITFPRAKITSLIFIFIFFTIRDIPAVYFLLFWFLLQVWNAVSTIGILGNTVAWWAHIGGFLAGILLMLLLRKRNRWQINP